MSRITNLIWSALIASTIYVFTSTLVFADDRTVIDIPRREPIVLKFRAFDPSRVLIDEQQILRGLTAAFQTKSKWPLTSKRKSPFTQLSGLSTSLDQQNSRIDFQYVNVERHDNSTESGQRLTISLTYQFERSNDDVSLKLSTPEKGEVTTRSLLFFTPPKLIQTNDELLEDFGNIFVGASTIKLKFQTLAKGELSAPFKPESAVANFERILGRHSYGYSDERIYDLKRDNVFSYRVGQDRLPLKIAAFPYRDGTKIVYEVRLPYQIVADGSFDGYELPQALKTDLAKVLND